VSLISLRVSLRLDCDSNNVSDVPTTRQVSKNITSDCLVERDHGSDVSPHPSDTEATNQSEVNHNIVTSKHTLRGSAVPWLIIYLAILSSTFWPVETYNQIHQIMAILIQPTKKRNRPTSQAAHESSSRMSTTNKPSSPPPDDEYEHVTFIVVVWHCILGRTLIHHHHRRVCRRRSTTLPRYIIITSVVAVRRCVVMTSWPPSKKKSHAVVLLIPVVVPAPVL
jgi:hypothetical protein